MSTTANNNYAPPRSRLADPAAPIEFELASRGSRFGAVTIDGLIFGTPWLVLVVSELSSIGVAGAPTNAFAIWSSLWRHLGPRGYVCLSIELVLILITAALVHQNAQTIGKKVCGIKVARVDGSRATLTRIFFLRYLPGSILRLVPVLAYVYGLADPLFIFGEPRRCIHDYIAGTIVIRA